MRVCVWGSSSSRTPAAHLGESRELGRLLAEGGHLNINGGGSTGCMGALNQGGIAAGGHIRGVVRVAAAWPCCCCRRGVTKLPPCLPAIDPRDVGGGPKLR
jgi:hypothetical protein